MHHNSPRIPHQARLSHSASATDERARLPTNSTQKGGLEIPKWLEWFLDCLGRAIEEAGKTLATVINKARFWESYACVPFNDRQRLLLSKLLDGFEGKLTTSKWAKLAKCSQDTALRDILSLVECGVLAKDSAGGRSTSYSLREY